MFYKEDWQQAKERFLAFWQAEILDRCCIAVRAPRDGSHYRPPEPPGDPVELEKWWLDPEDNLKRMVTEFENTYYGGEAYPATTMCLGASVMAGFYGSPAEYRQETVWYQPVINDWAAFPVEFHPAINFYYKVTMDALRYYVQESRGRFLVSLPELGTATDDLSLMRGMQPLLFDMVDDPLPVERAIQTMAKTWNQVHLEMYNLAHSLNDDGCPIAWMQSWAPGPHFQLSCDFSSILSPKMFKKFIIPELETYLQVNTFGVYHWDGPDAVKHLEALLAMKDIDAIQWTQGDGSLPAADPQWIPNYKKIQAAGKKLILPFVEINEVETLLGQLSSRGLLLVTRASSEAEANELLRKVSGWTRD
jgi:hypothetical protein